MDINDVLKLDNQLCFAMYTCSREITKKYKPHLDKINLTYTQYITMLVLWENPEITVKELGNKLYLDSGTLTPLLKKLEKLGFIDRKRDSGDERSVIIKLTQAGNDLKEKAKDIPEKLFCNSGISLEEAVSLREQLKTIIRQINTEE